MTDAAGVPSYTLSTLATNTGNCATVNTQTKQITYRCAAALAKVYEEVWKSVDPDLACKCTDKTTACITNAPWDAAAVRCIIVPDNSTLLQSVCYGPCEDVAL